MGNIKTSSMKFKVRQSVYPHVDLVEFIVHFFASFMSSRD